MTTPDFSPESLDRLLDQAREMAVEYVQGLPERHAFRRPPDELVAQFRDAPLPLMGVSSDEIMSDIARDVLPHSLGIGHPRWWGYVRPSPAPIGAAAALLVNVMNNNCAGSAQLATHMEMTVVRWLAEMAGYPGGAGGILLSGGSAANFVALSAMREAMLPGSRVTGLVDMDRTPAIYASPEAHSSIRRAAEMLGLGSDAIRLVPVDAELRTDVTQMERMIRDDRANGRLPLCVVGSAGTVNTGVIDPLDDLLRLARAEGLWFHVDGAYGAFGAALPELADRYCGMEQADSLTLDPHKWLYVPYEAGCILVRDRDALTRAFATRAEYLEVRDDDYFNGPMWFYQQGPQLSRGFRALKVWAVIRQIGLAGYRTLWRNDIAAAAELRKLCEAHPQLEPVGTTDLSICCFRYLPSTGDPDRFNQRLLDRIQQDGRLFVSGTRVAERFCLRACIMNFRTTTDDIHRAVKAIVELAEALAETGAMT